jgi:predicted DNA-binding transcriptional regulator AlpA
MSPTIPLLRPSAAADRLGVSANTLAKKRLSGDGPTYIRLSPRAIGYLQSDLDEWVSTSGTHRHLNTAPPASNRL